jgi:hypothetical protein
MIHISLLRYDHPNAVTFTLNQDTGTAADDWHWISPRPALWSAEQIGVFPQSLRRW